MKNIIRFTNCALVIAALGTAPAVAQSSGGTSGTSSTNPQGTASTAPRSGGGQSDRDSGKKKTSSGDTVGDDVPSQGTQTDQRGRTAAKGAGEAGGLRGPDRTFLLDAMEGNKAESDLATLAQQKASSAQVKEYAQMLQKDHGAANAKLKSIAGESGAANNEPALKPAHTQLQQRLSKLEGAAFDKAYMAEMVKEHEKDVQKYQQASTSLQHAGLKSYATETLPTLKQHLDHARKVAQGASAQR
jgi:putative membrane protein